ncbi:replication protein A 70 kDa DNA-binding subunit C-like [Cornus florida]|uniref:replication protein A 70 kDa DNA-binding subunit C-like n=1 Tax=Cornus florida TaxID=4283 RepID=UPI00289A0A6D|nr:replication protein A 70 kDa DNA-binding subunit C-like [Cornus florida]XP_059635935.1 replication protein A 70 kDa DNA-binding subunit C-like [Cornus florida]
MAETEAKDWQEMSGIMGSQERGTNVGTSSKSQDRKRHRGASLFSQEQQTTGVTPIVGVSSRSSRTSVMCYQCRQPRHSKAECPLDRPSFGVCFLCGQPGHMKRDCPQRR